MKRREAREIAFYLTFEKDFMKEDSCKDIYDKAIVCLDKPEISDDPYIYSTFVGVFNHLEEIDSMIEEASANWETERISRVSKAIIRLAAYEIIYVPDIPVKIAVNEAVEISKKFDDEKAFSFINGVLAKIALKADKTDE